METKKLKIVIKDLPEGKRVGREEMRKVFGGCYPDPKKPLPWPWPQPKIPTEPPPPWGPKW